MGARPGRRLVGRGGDSSAEGCGRQCGRRPRAAGVGGRLTRCKARRPGDLVQGGLILPATRVPGGPAAGHSGGRATRPATRRVLAATGSGCPRRGAAAVPRRRGERSAHGAGHCVLAIHCKGGLILLAARVPRGSVAGRCGGRAIRPAARRALAATGSGRPRRGAAAARGWPGRRRRRRRGGDHGVARCGGPPHPNPWSALRGPSPQGERE